MIYDIFIAVGQLCAMFLLLSLCFLIAQILVERFILTTLPVIMDLYGRIKYPEHFKDD